MTEGTSNSLFTHNVPPSFTITLVSSASMNVLKDNTLVNFKNLLNEEINLQGEWRVAVTEITFPTQINNVTDNNIVYYKKDRVIASMKVEKDKISRPYLGETAKITKGEYTSRHYRQRGSGFGALALGIGRVALPLARKFVIPAAKKNRKRTTSSGSSRTDRSCNKKKNS